MQIQFQQEEVAGCLPPVCQIILMTVTITEEHTHTHTHTSVLNRPFTGLHITTENRPARIPVIPAAGQPLRKPSVSSLRQSYRPGENNKPLHRHCCGDAFLSDLGRLLVIRNFFPPPTFFCNQAKPLFTVYSLRKQQTPPE